MTPGYLLEPGKEEGDDDALQKIFCKQITRQLVTLKIILYLFCFVFIQSRQHAVTQRRAFLELEGRGYATLGSPGAVHTETGDSE